jgi:hypothetical protein
MSDYQICPTCGHENPESAGACAKCSATLQKFPTGNTTRDVPPPDEFSLPSLPSIKDLPRNVVGLYILNQKEPILYRFSNKRLMLGRDVPPDALPAIDLAHFKAALLGVSRKHAIIKPDNQGGYALEDLGSTNGTWVNNHQLQPYEPHPLNNGAQIRLAHLTMHINFSESVIQEDILYLKHQTGNLAAITPDEIETQISPYITTIGTLQDIIHAYLERDPADVSIQSISMEDSTIAIKMTGATEAVRFIQTHVAVWRKQYQQERGTSSAATQSTDPSKHDETRPINTDNLLAELVRALLKDLAPTLNTSQLDISGYTARLAPHLQLLIASKLHIVSDPADANT